MAAIAAFHTLLSDGPFGKHQLVVWFHNWTFIHLLIYIYTFIHLADTFGVSHLGLWGIRRESLFTKLIPHSPLLMLHAPWFEAVVLEGLSLAPLSQRLRSFSRLR